MPRLRPHQPIFQIDKIVGSIAVGSTPPAQSLLSILDILELPGNTNGGYVIELVPAEGDFIVGCFDLTDGVPPYLQNFVSVDANDPTALAVLDSISIDDFNSSRFVARPGYAYVGGLGTQEVDIVALGSMAPGAIEASAPGGARAIDGGGDVLYAAMTQPTRGIRVVDVSTPGSPSLITNLTAYEYAYDILVVGDHLFAVNGLLADPRMYSIDISTPASPVLADEIVTPHAPRGLTLNNAGSHLFAASSGGYLMAIDITDPTNISVTSSLQVNDTMSTLTEACVHGERLYTPVHDSGTNPRIAVVDITNPAAMDYIGDFADPAIGPGGVRSLRSNGLDGLFAICKPDATAAIVSLLAAP